MKMANSQARHLTPAMLFGIAAAILALTSVAYSADGKEAKGGDIVQETPTLKCLGVRWMIGGDSDRDARVTVAYRKSGDGEWRPGMDLFRVETAGLRDPRSVQSGHAMHAGSILDLEEGTEYEMRLTLTDPDGGDEERIVRMTTWIEPRLADDAPVTDVRPGELQKALDAAKPGDVLRLQPGVYRGTFTPPSGAKGKPIGIVGVERDRVILDGRGEANVISGGGVHDVMFENLTIQNARWAIAVNGGRDIVVRRCLIRDADYGIVAQHDAENQQRILITDNEMIGRSSWPRVEGIEDRRGVQISGSGNVVCRNRIHGYGDAIDTFSVYPCCAIDIYGNEISECTDDGIEMDYSEHNTRCFDNRLTNVYQGASMQPVHGGPVYVFRNAMYNVAMEPFKLHNHPSGALIYQNTSVKAGPPHLLMTGDPVSNCVSRNNLFLGTSGAYAYESTARMRDCDFDYDGFGGEWNIFIKWNGARYPTMEELVANGPVYRHARRVDPATAFRSGIAPPETPDTEFDVDVNDLRLAPESDAIDGGIALPGINDNFKGDAPDLGAYELGAELPHYGPRPESP